MIRSRRFLGISAGVAAVFLLPGSGIYAWIGSGSGEEAEAGDSASQIATTASQSFDTGIAIPAEGSPAVRDTLVIAVSDGSWVPPIVSGSSRRYRQRFQGPKVVFAARIPDDAPHRFQVSIVKLELPFSMRHVDYQAVAQIDRQRLSPLVDWVTLTGPASAVVRPNSSIVAIQQFGFAVRVDRST